MGARETGAGSPYDPDAAAAAAGIEVTYWESLPYLGIYLRHDGMDAIALRAELQADERARRATLAHELGHHALTAGLHVGVYRCRAADLASSQAEIRAERWAGERLLPVAELRALARRRGRLGLEDITELADWALVPPAFAFWWVQDVERRGLLLAAGHR